MLIISYNSYYSSNIIILLVIIIDKYEYNIQLGWIAKLLHYIMGVKLYYYMILTMLTMLIISCIIYNTYTYYCYYSSSIVSDNYNYR